MNIMNRYQQESTVHLKHFLNVLKESHIQSAKVKKPCMWKEKKTSLTCKKKSHIISKDMGGGTHKLSRRYKENKEIHNKIKKTKDNRLMKSLCQSLED